MDTTIFTKEEDQKWLSDKKSYRVVTSCSFTLTFLVNYTLPFITDEKCLPI